MDPALRQATSFGKYVLLERVSVGGMAEVFKAKAFGVEGFEKILAIKRILPSMADDADFIEMFIDEAKICGQLNHANICQIFELGRVETSHFIAMEYIWGKDLLQMQNRFRKLRQKMKPEMAAYIGCKICEGLDYAHKKKDAQGRPLGIIHRDISPQNIIVSYEGELKIIDFGIAKAASRSSKTQAGVLKGKFGYMSPEQVRGLPLDRRSDLFAIGTILYELLTADRLFYGESDFETLEKVRNVDVLPPSQVNPAVPKSLERIIMRALAKDVEGRYQWASEMAEDLNSFLTTHDPVFSSTNLSQWMREQFSVEMRRERVVLDEQQKVTRELLAHTSNPTMIAPEVRPNQRSSPSTPAIAAPPIPHGDDDDDFNEKTTVSGPAFGSPLPAESLPEQSTRILDSSFPSPGGVTPAQAALAAENTIVFMDGAGPQRPSMSGQHPGGPLDVQPFGPTVVGDPSMVYPPPPSPHNGIVATPHTPHYGQLMPPSQRPAPTPRSTVWKDIVLGIAVAGLVVGGVLGARFYFAHRGQGTLVVVCPTGTGELLIDGATRGQLSAGTPMTFKAFPLGEHTVVVRADGGEFQQNVVLVAGDVSVVNANLAAGNLIGKLRLEIEAPNASGTYVSASADVYVDGVLQPVDAAQTGIALRTGSSRGIRVSKAGFADKRFSVEARGGETQVRQVRLDVAGASLAVNTEPSGADVSVNGRRVGVTPTTVNDLDSGHFVRVSIKLAGYQSVSKSVSFEGGRAQTLDVKLVAGKDSDTSDGKGEQQDTKPEGKNKAGTKTARDPMDPKDKDPDNTAVAKPFPSDGLAQVSFGKDNKEKSGSQEPGYLVANTQPWAKVLIDGKDTGKTTPVAPRSKISVKPGKHTVTFVVSGKKYNFDISVRSGEQVVLMKQLADAPP